MKTFNALSSCLYVVGFRYLENTAAAEVAAAAAIVADTPEGVVSSLSSTVRAPAIHRRMHLSCIAPRVILRFPPRHN